MFAALAILVLQFNSVVRVKAQESPYAPYSCGYVDVMSQEMRQAVLNVHNKLREDLALGKVQGSSLSGEKLPKAADMRQMRYDCALEKKALDVGVFQDNCKEIPPRQAFTDTDRNYRSIDTTMLLNRPVISPKEALVKAAHDWWNQHFYYKLKGVTPQKDGFPAIPFFMMAMGATEEIGCALNFCSSGARNYYAVYCFYGAPHVKPGIALYKEGKPCTKCPVGYECPGLTKLCRKIKS